MEINGSKIMYEKLICLIYLSLGLILLYQFMASESFLLKYVGLVLGIFDISMLIMRVGLYNYHNGYYWWLK